MIRFDIDDFDSTRGLPKGESYYVRSSLSGVHSKSEAPSISTKLVYSGLERYTACGTRFNVRKGQFLLVPPGQQYEIDIEEQTTGCCFYYQQAHFDQLFSELISDDLEGATQSDSILFSPICLPASSTRIGKLISAIANYELEVDSDFLTCELVHSVAELSKHYQKLAHKKLSSKRELISRLELARAYILDNLNAPLNLKSLEAECNLSKFHMVRAFTLAYGEPPLRYHQNARLDLAKQRVSSGEPISDICFDLAFSSLSSFSRAYQRRHSCPPSQDRPNKQFR